MANAEETPIRMALSPAVTEVNHSDREIRRVRILLMLLMFVETVSVLVPRNSNHWTSEFRFLPQILVGFVFLALILMLHLASQRKILQDVSTALVAATSYADRLEQMSLIDPATQLFNRRYLNELFNHQRKWLNRSGRAANLLLMEVHANEENAAAEAVVLESAFIFRSNFRGSDYLVRYSPEQFLVVMPDTDEPAAQIALCRLIDKVDRWNRANENKEMALRLALCTYLPGGDIWQCLSELEQKMQAKTDPEVRTFVPPKHAPSHTQVDGPEEIRVQ